MFEGTPLPMSQVVYIVRKTKREPFQRKKPLQTYRDYRVSNTILYLFFYNAEEEIAEAEIAEAEGMAKMTVSEVLSQKIPDLEKSDKVLAHFGDADFQVPLYNVWTQ